MSDVQMTEISLTVNTEADGSFKVEVAAKDAKGDTYFGRRRKGPAQALIAGLAARIAKTAFGSLIPVNIEDDEISADQ